MQEILKPALVIHCGHCPEARVFWVENDTGKPPDLVFRGFPKGGRLMMSKENVLLACDRCKAQLDVIQAEHGKTLWL